MLQHQSGDARFADATERNQNNGGGSRAIPSWSSRRKEDAYVSLERAELKGRFVAASRPRCLARRSYEERYEETNGPTLEETKSPYVR